MDDPLKRATGLAARHLDTIRERSVGGEARPVDLRRRLRAAYTFEKPMKVAAVLDDVAGMFDRGLVHATHPGYFGLFQPGLHRSAVAASTLVAAYNPQAATYTHGAAAIELEQHTLRFLGEHLGFEAETVSAHFTSGGQEANTESIAVALARLHPATVESGLRALPGSPRIYVSVEAHHSFEKAAALTGLGHAAVRRVPVDAALRLDVEALRDRLAADRASGDCPVMIVGTAGTTSSGAIDPLDELASVAAAEGLFFHVDAAYGGAAMLSSRLRSHLRGIERADSVTFDAHKWLQVPLGAGMFFTRHREAARAAFGTTSPYMPRPRDGFDDPFQVSHAWSRRASGVPLFVALAELGEAGFATMIESMAALGDRLRERLVGEGFVLVQSSPLPVVCFTHPRLLQDELTPGEVARRLHRGGRVWIAPTELSGGVRVLRACITHHATSERELDVLMESLRAAVAVDHDAR